MKRLLPANYYNVLTADSGKDLTLQRVVVRTTVLREGLLKHQDLTQLLPGYMLYNFFDFGSIHDIILNSLLPVNMCMVWYLRHHNYIAEKLAEVNPCWDDETLFQHARDINIAFAQHFLRYKTLLKTGIIGDRPGFRDIYDKNSYPLVTLEFAYGLRWFHTIQDQTSKLIDTKGNEVGEYPMFNITFKTGWMAKENRMTYLTQGIFRDASHDSDHSITYDVGERGVPNLQLAVDIATSDLHKGRLLGMPPYCEYVYYFSGINITGFEDLAQMMKPSQILLLKKVYETVEDIDLMAGLWSENLIEGGKIPRTLAYIIQVMMLNTIKGDKYWYERERRPHKFTLSQLLEVRKSTVASLLCAVGDGVTEIQKRAFLNISPENPLVNCSEIPHIDFSAWADPTCA